MKTEPIVPAQITFQCPTTHQEITVTGREFTGDGKIKYPFVSGIPWLFPDPKHTLHEWRVRSQQLLDQLTLEIENLKQAKKESSSTLTRERLENIRNLKIRHLEMMKSVLEPLKPAMKMSLISSKAFGYRLPLRQGLLGYFPNLIRDWSLNFESENAQLVEATLSVLNQHCPISHDHELKILVLGSGGSRLAYDLAKLYPRSQFTAFDLNPILLLAAERLNQNKKIHAVEMSVSAKDANCPGQQVELSLPGEPAPNLHFVFGDVYALPFQDSSFDLVISPWLIDILPRRLNELCASVARVTKSEGHWINSGSWHFDFKNEIDNLSLSEANEIAEKIGWHPKASNQIEVPYLQSQFDAHRRFETLTQFCWERAPKESTQNTTHHTTPSFDDRAIWIREPGRPVPALPIFLEGSETHAIQALVLSLVDGQKSLNEISEIVSRENGLSLEDASEATQTFFDRLIKDHHFR